LLLTVHSDPKNFIGKLPMILISPQKKAEHTRQYFSCLAQNKSPICNADKKRFSTLSAQLNLQQFDQPTSMSFIDIGWSNFISQKNHYLCPCLFQLFSAQRKTANKNQRCFAPPIP
jgi:hypothetical protein